MAREEKAVFTNMCMVTDGNGNVLVQDRLNPDWPALRSLAVMWSRRKALRSL